MRFPYVFLFCTIKLSVTPIFCLPDSNLVNSYFREKSIKSAVVFECLNKKEQVTLAKSLMTQNRFVQVLNINRPGLEKSLKTTHEHIGVILNGDCRNSENFLLTSGKMKFFDVKHHWLVLSTSQYIVKKFEKVTLNVDSDIHIAINSASESWDILDLYNSGFDLGGHLFYKKIGHYNQMDGYKIRQKPKYLERKNMTGITFKTAIGLIEPYEEPVDKYLQSESNKSLNTFNKFQHTLLRFCASYYNYTMITEVVHSWGYASPNGSFDGKSMVGKMVNKLIHFGSSPVFIRPDRIGMISFGRKTWSWKAGFVFRIPKSRNSIDTFLKPLSTSIWVITGILAVISIVILKGVTSFEKKKRRGAVETSWSLAVIFILGAFCQQGSSSVPTMACGRITALSIFLLSVLMYQFYSASIVSNLLQKPTYQINDLKALLESPLKVGCEDMVYSRDLFAHTTDKVIKELYNKKIYRKDNTSNYFSTRDGLELVKNGGYAFHVESQRAYPIIEATFSGGAICELREVRLLRYTDLYSTYQKDTPFYNMLETCIQRLAEYGIISKEVTHWHPRKPECIQTSQSVATFHVGLEEFYPALLVLLFGVILSLTLLIVEIYVFSRKQQDVETKYVFPFNN